MQDLIDENKLIHFSQYGLRKARSSDRAILDIVETLQKNMDKHYFSLGVFRGIINEWFQSYLTNRTQTT